jgi:hypothetical protein
MKIKVYYLPWHDCLVTGTDPDHLYGPSPYFEGLVLIITLSPVIYVGEL